MSDHTLTETQQKQCDRLTKENLQAFLVEKNTPSYINHEILINLLPAFLARNINANVFDWRDVAQGEIRYNDKDGLTIKIGNRIIFWDTRLDKWFLQPK